MARRSNVSSGLEAFRDAYSTTKSVMSDYEEEKRKRAIRAGLKAARADAEASGGTVHTLDKGGDDTGVADYQSKDAADIDMIAKQEDDIRSLQGEPAGLTPQMARGTSAETVPLADVRPGPGTAMAAPGLETTPPPSMAAAQLPEAEQAMAAQALEGSAAAQPTTTPEQGYTRQSIERPKSAMMDLFHKKYAPKIVADLYEAGDLDRAKAFEDWTRSAKGAAYAETWMKTTQAKMSGDETGTMTGAIELYNKQLPDGQYAVGVPSKDGKEFSVQIRDEKTNKLIDTKKGSLPDMSQAAITMLAPEKAFSFLYGEQEKEKSTKAALEKEQRGYAHAEKIAAIKDNGNPSTLSKVMAEREAIAAANPKDPRLAKYDQYIDNYGKPQTTNVTFSAGLQEMAGGGMGQPSNKGGPLNPVPNAVDPRQEKVTQATNALSGVTPVKPPPTKDNPSPMPYLMRNGTPLYPYGPTKAEYEAVQKHMETLRQAKQPMPWEKKPGLK